MTKTASPFPIPSHFQCPYCAEAKALRGSLGADERWVKGQFFFCHHVKKRVQAGKLISVTLDTLHQFAIVWKGTKWEPVTTGIGCHEMCERVELRNGSHTDWEAYNREDLDNG